MKISDRQYATALYESVVDKTAKDLDKTIKSFVDLLKINRHISRFPKILDIFNAVWSHNEGQAEVSITSARKLSNESREEILKYLAKEGLTDAQLSESIDENLLGGFVARFQGLIIDASLRSSLSTMQKNISN